MKDSNFLHEDMSLLLMADTLQDSEIDHVRISDKFGSQDKAETHKAFDTASNVASV